MKVLDVIVISTVLLGIVWGAKRGFIGIVVLVVGLIVTIVVIDAFASPLSLFFVKVGVGEESAYAVAILSILIVSFTVFFIIHTLLKSLVDLFRVGWINRTFGALLGGWVLFVFVGSILFFLTKIPLLGFKKYVDSSLVAKYSYSHAKDIMSLSGSEERVNKILEGGGGQ